MKVLVIGASAGTGKQVVEQLIARGHAVTAFARSADKMRDLGPLLTRLSGDALDAAQVERAVAGHDAVVVTLGISDNPIGVRLWGGSKTPVNVRSAGTDNVLRAMERTGVRRLVVLTSFGVGPTRALLSTVEKLFFALVLKPQIADTELQQAAVEASALDWTIIQPVNLTDGRDVHGPVVAADGAVGARKVSRGSVAKVIAQAVAEPAWLGKVLAVSARQGSAGAAEAGLRRSEAQAN